MITYADAVTRHSVIGYYHLLEKIFDACGVGERSFYYPYPDYKFMTTVYSDAYLPGRGELSNNLRNFDRDRMLLFDEKSAFSFLDFMVYYAHSGCGPYGPASGRESTR